MSTERLKAALPLAFDSGTYRALHGDLRRMSDDELQRHYVKYGIKEGRRSHSLPDRAAFMALAQSVEALELSPSSDLSTLNGSFDAVWSSHLLQRQPDLIRHLKAVERLLRPGGMYLLLVPDKRYGADHFLAPSTIADVLDAHHSGRLLPSLHSQLEHAALTTHDNSAAHWADEHGAPAKVAEHIQEAIRRYRAEPDGYVDAHAWYFTPTTFEQIVGLLHELGHTTLTVSRVYQSLKDSNEFWAVLEAPSR